MRDDGRGGWSWTQINDFLDSPSTWFDKYVMRQRTPPTPAITIGDAFHKAADVALKRRMGEISGEHADKT